MEPLSKRVEITLKTPGASDAQKSQFFKSLKVGGIVCGRIKRIEKYGLFITIDNTNMVSKLTILRRKVSCDNQTCL